LKVQRLRSTHPFEIIPTGGIRIAPQFSKEGALPRPIRIWIEEVEIDE
jgi:hypothetical protein